MTPKEFKEAMSKIVKGDDQEERHIDADTLIVSYMLRDATIEEYEALQMFLDMEKWYS